MKDKDERGKLMSLGWGVDLHAPHRLILSVMGMDKIGKTHFALTSPPPIAYFDIDEGMGELIGKFPKLVPGENFYRYDVSYDADDPDQTEKQVDGMIEALRAALAAPDDVVRSIVFDTDTEWWEMLRLARFGRLTEVLPNHYGPVNMEYKNLIRQVRHTGKNLILLHKMKEEYKPKKNKKSGKMMSEWTGDYVLDGMKDVRHQIQTGVRLFKDADGYGCEIVKCRQDPTLEGIIVRTSMEEVEEGGAGAGMCNFPNVAALVTGTDPSEWGGEGDGEGEA